MSDPAALARDQSAFTPLATLSHHGTHSLQASLPPTLPPQSYSSIVAPSSDAARSDGRGDDGGAGGSLLAFEPPATLDATSSVREWLDEVRGGFGSRFAAPFEARETSAKGSVARLGAVSVPPSCQGDDCRLIFQMVLEGGLEVGPLPDLKPIEVRFVNTARRDAARRQQEEEEAERTAAIRRLQREHTAQWEEKVNVERRYNEAALALASKKQAIAHVAATFRTELGVQLEPARLARLAAAPDALQVDARGVAHHHSWVA